jgi:Ca2+-binding RTX toxin-like protein
LTLLFSFQAQPAPLAITIRGYAGDDIVDFTAAAVAANNDFGGTPPPGIPVGGVSRLIFFGNDGDDELTPPIGKVALPGAGAPPNITFYGNQDDDTLVGRTPAGADPLAFYGEAGVDNATGGAGDDVLSGGDGTDTMAGGWGHDILDGGNETDTLDGEGGNDQIDGGNGDDILDGGSWNDTITGGPGNDTIDGGPDDDEIDGGPDNDILVGDTGNDSIETGASGPAATLSPPSGGSFFEIAYGNDGDDLIDANSATGSAYLDGGNHDDVIAGTAYADTINGGSGVDWLFGNAGNDTMSGGAGDDWMLSNNITPGPDQPYGGLGGTPGWMDMQGTGNAGCNVVDEHEEGDAGCFSSGGGGGGSGAGGGGSMGGEGEFVGEMSFVESAPILPTFSTPMAKTQGPSPKVAALLATRRMMELTPSGEWQPAEPVLARTANWSAASLPALPSLDLNRPKPNAQTTADAKKPAKSDTEEALDYLFAALAEEKK